MKAHRFGRERVARYGLLVFRAWRRSADERRRLYRWSESLVIGVVDGVLDRQRAQQHRARMMRDIERRRKCLLEQKLEFRALCRRFVRGNGKRRERLRAQIESYLQRKGERKEALAMIVRDVTRLTQRACGYVA